MILAAWSAFLFVAVAYLIAAACVDFRRCPRGVGTPGRVDYDPPARGRVPGRAPID